MKHIINLLQYIIWIISNKKCLRAIDEVQQSSIFIVLSLIECIYVCIIIPESLLLVILSQGSIFVVFKSEYALVLTRYC